VFFKLLECLSFDREGHLCKNKLIILNKIDTTDFNSSQELILRNAKNGDEPECSRLLAWGHRDRTLP